jgi:ribosomal protein L15
MFKIIAEIFEKSQKQYIATINQNQLNEIKQNLSPDEFKTIIEENTVLSLTDDSDAEKLLGITVDIGNN